MLVVGLQGSPRKNGNTDRLLLRFLNASAGAGARTRTIVASRETIVPCRGCGYCEKKGRCVIGDDFMAAEGYRLLRQADVIVAATPVFFYAMTAQLKALVDRTQALWSRKYRFNLTDPSAFHRKGLLLSVGGSHGKTLFDAIELSARYFFDAVGARYAGALTYRGVESPGDVETLPGLDDDIREMVDRHIAPLAARRRILVVGKHDAFAGPMAAALLQQGSGGSIAVHSAGIDAAERLSPECVAAMKEIGIDLAWQQPESLEKAMDRRPFHTVIRLTRHRLPHMPAGVNSCDWQLPDCSGLEAKAARRRTREALEKQARAFLDSIDAVP
jgi:arsenate reductase